MKKTNRNLLLGLAFSSPWIIGFLAFGLYPIIISLYYSFTDYNLLQQPNWIGTENYGHMMNDSVFWESLYNTLYITVLGVPFSIGVGLGCALMLNQKVRGISVFRTLMYIPSIIPPVAVTIVWMFILNPDYGLMNEFLTLLHLPKFGWLASPNYSKTSMLLMVLWQSGQIIVILLAGLQDVPASLYEAARIDGAGKWKTFRNVTLPMLGPIIFYNVILGTVNFLQFFTQAFVATAKDLGAPAGSLTFYAIYIYQNAFVYLKLGYASSLSWGLLVITLLLTYLLFKFSKRTVHYGGE